MLLDDTVVLDSQEAMGEVVAPEQTPELSTHSAAIPPAPVGATANKLAELKLALPDLVRMSKDVQVLDRSRKRNPFYHRRLTEYLRFAVPEGESVLILGCDDGALLAAVKPARGVGIDSRSALITAARQRHPEYEYHASTDYTFSLPEKFDYVVVNDVLDEVHDVFKLLEHLAKVCTPTARVVLIQPNYLWRPLHRLGFCTGARGLRARDNLLSAGDLRVILEGVGFEIIDVRPKLFSPRRLLGLGVVVNWLGGILPFAHRFASTNVLVARPAPAPRAKSQKSASIVLTVRDERENIEPMVRAIPPVGSSTEIIIVEGHSSDGTRAEIERVIQAYPQRHVRLLVQSGHGVANAIQEGFAAARGDIIIFLEADQTCPPDDVLKVFSLIASGRAEYVSGSRFIYPRGPGSMPLLNVVGNWLFAAWFTWFLGQRTSDVLCGLKGIERTQFRRLMRNWGFLGVNDPFSDFELAFGVSRLGLKICEVPTRYCRRRYGTTKTKFFKHGFMLARMAARATRVFRCR